MVTGTMRVERGDVAVAGVEGVRFRHAAITIRPAPTSVELAAKWNAETPTRNLLRMHLPSDMNAESARTINDLLDHYFQPFAQRPPTFSLSLRNAYAAANAEASLVADAWLPQSIFESIATSVAEGRKLKLSLFAELRPHLVIDKYVAHDEELTHVLLPEFCYAPNSSEGWIVGASWVALGEKPRRKGEE